MRNIDCQQVFKENTSKNPRLVEVLQKGDVISGGAKWIKEVKHEIAKSFKKVRVSTAQVKPNKELGDLFEDRENIKARISNVLEIEEQKVLKDKLE